MRLCRPCGMGHLVSRRFSVEVVQPRTSRPSKSLHKAPRSPKVEPTKQITPKLFDRGLKLSKSFTERILELTQQGDYAGVYAQYEDRKRQGLKFDAQKTTRLINAAALDRNLDKAFEFYFLHKQLNIPLTDPVVNAILKAIHMVKQYSRAFEIWSDARAQNTVLSVGTLGIFIKQFARSNDIESLLRVAELLKDMQCKPDNAALEGLIEGLSTTGDFERVQGYFDDLKAAGFTATSFTYTHLMNAYRLSNQYDKVFEIFELMKKEGIPPTEYIFSSLMLSCAAIKDADRATTLFHECITAGLKESVRVYNMLLEVLAEAKKPEPLIFVMDVMRSKGLRPNSDCYNRLFRALESQDDMFAADRYYEEMKQTVMFHKTDHAFNAYLIHNARSGFSPKIEKVLEDMDRFSVQKTEWTYAIVIYACAVSRDLDRAKSYFYTMKENMIQPNVIVYNSVIQAAIRSGRIDEAIRYLQKMKSENIKPSTLLSEYPITFRFMVTISNEIGDSAYHEEISSQMLNEVLTSADNNIQIRSPAFSSPATDEFLDSLRTA